MFIMTLTNKKERKKEEKKKILFFSRQRFDTQYYLILTDLARLDLIPVSSPW